MVLHNGSADDHYDGHPAVREYAVARQAELTKEAPMTRGSGLTRDAGPEPGAGEKNKKQKKATYNMYKDHYRRADPADQPVTEQAS
jgi:hypothetical protein